MKAKTGRTFITVHEVTENAGVQPQTGTTESVKPVAIPISHILKVEPYRKPTWIRNAQAPVEMERTRARIIIAGKDSRDVWTTETMEEIVELVDGPPAPPRGTLPGGVQSCVTTAGAVETKVDPRQYQALSFQQLGDLANADLGTQAANILDTRDNSLRTGIVTGRGSLLGVNLWDDVVKRERTLFFDRHNAKQVEKDGTYGPLLLVQAVNTPAIVARVLSREGVTTSTTGDVHEGCGDKCGEGRA